MRDPNKETYSFSTDTGASYEILFVLRPDIFSTTDLEVYETYDFIIDKLESGDGRKDPEVKNTIAAIIDYFFRDKDRILIFVFDSLDGKQEIRKRLFDIWAENNPLKDKIFKVDNSIVTSDMTYYTGVLYHKDHILGKQNITDSIDEVNYILTSDK